MTRAPAPSARAGENVPVWIHATLAGIALAAVGVPALIVATTPRVVMTAPKIAAAQQRARVVPKAELPPVEPVALIEVAPQDARSINASIPFSTLPNPAARAFRLTGDEASQGRAVDCLAAAVYYEAGDDPVGQRAVAQVVLNRVRHPAFPKTVCGVVFQGSERRTGCQFTFTCDGALRRTPSAAAWDRARFVARAALTGTVYKPVGHATHYHTDWVVPYWSASLEKITEVHTHLFFRWTGWWGTPGAFNRGYGGVEPVVAQLGALSPGHRVAGTVPEALAEAETRTDLPADASVPQPTDSDANVFLVTLDKGVTPDQFPALAIRACGERAYCKFFGWRDGARKPAQFPITQAQIGTMSFSYLRDERQGFAKALWNCDEFRRPSAVQCMRRQPGAVAKAPEEKGAQPASARDPLPDANGGPEPLAGIRRKKAATETPAPTPSPAPANATVRFSMPAPKASPAARD